jgi:tRNA threonylcarbamoyladenosine biosynthesis protein TsaE
MKNRIEKVISDTNELDSLAHDLISFAGQNKIWAFYGEMGAGKTTFIRHICSVFGVKENVSSPTFALINEYKAKMINTIYHFDFYRIEKESEAVNIGCEEYFESGSLCLIEWPEKILNLLPHPLIKIEIIVTGNIRKFTFSYE